MNILKISLVLIFSFLTIFLQNDCRAEYNRLSKFETYQLRQALHNKNTEHCFESQAAPISSLGKFVDMAIETAIFTSIGMFIGWLSAETIKYVIFTIATKYPPITAPTETTTLIVSNIEQTDSKESI